MSRDVSVFDDCNLSDVKVYLNSKFYPYNDLNLDFGKKRYAVLFNMYARTFLFFVKHIMESTASKRSSMCSRVSRKGFLRSLIARDKMNPSKAPLWTYA